MIDVTLANFETEVIEASQTVPVLVDFWAPWCGPCKTLGPVLEKVEAAYAGRFKLVKINTEDEQQLAQAFGIRSIPTCVLMMNGQPVDGFMGVQPEGQLRAFLDKHVPSAEALQAEEQEEEAQEALAEGDADTALEKLQHAVATDPANDEARFGRARWLMARQRWQEAMDELLEILMRDKAWNDEAARKTYVAILEIIEPPKPKVAEGQIPPEDPVVAAYRRRLSSVVLS